MDPKDLKFGALHTRMRKAEKKNVFLAIKEKYPNLTEKRINTIIDQLYSPTKGSKNKAVVDSKQIEQLASRRKALTGAIDDDNNVTDEDVIAEFNDLSKYKPTQQQEDEIFADASTALSMTVDEVRKEFYAQKKDDVKAVASGGKASSPPAKTIPSAHVAAPSAAPSPPEAPTTPAPPPPPATPTAPPPSTPNALSATPPPPPHPKATVTNQDVIGSSSNTGIPQQPLSLMEEIRNQGQKKLKKTKAQTGTSPTTNAPSAAPPPPATTQSTVTNQDVIGSSSNTGIPQQPLSLLDQIKNPPKMRLKPENAKTQIMRDKVRLVILTQFSDRKIENLDALIQDVITSKSQQSLPRLQNSNMINAAKNQGNTDDNDDGSDWDDDENNNQPPKLPANNDKPLTAQEVLAKIPPFDGISQQEIEIMQSIGQIKQVSSSDLVNASTTVTKTNQSIIDDAKKETNPDQLLHNTYNLAQNALVSEQPLTENDISPVIDHIHDLAYEEFMTLTGTEQQDIRDQVKQAGQSFTNDRDILIYYLDHLA